MIKSINRLNLRLVDFFRKTDALSLYEDFLKTQWLPEEQIRQIQWKKINSLLNHAYHNVPYYQRIFDSNGMKPDDVKCIDDFRKIPILTKDIIRTNSKDMVSKKKKIFQAHRKATSGSTGNTLTFYMDRKSRSAQWATMYRQWNVGGWNPGDRIVFLGGSSIYPSVHALMMWFYVKLNNWLPLSAFDMSDENMGKWLEKIRRSGAKFMHAVAASAYILAKYAENNDIKGIRFNAVFTSADPLLPNYRETIQRVFSCDVFDLYGANDGGGFAFECEEHNGLHCVSEKALIEVLKEDGSAAGEGESGEIVSTDLLNYTMPFIRYKVGDIATVELNPCKCGRGLPLLKNIRGRSNDFVTTKGGLKVHWGYFAYLFREIDWISQFYVVQEDKYTLSIYLKPDMQPSKDKIAWIRNTIEKKFCGTNINIRFTGNIPIAASGKFKHIINKTLVQ